MDHRAQVGIECPQCHLRQYVEIGMDKTLDDSPQAKIILGHLQQWMLSRCPDHLGSIANLLKN